MKQKIVGMVVASALVTAAVTTAAASAAPAAKNTPAPAVSANNVLANPITTASLNVNGVNYGVKSLKANNSVLYSAADVADALGAIYRLEGSTATFLNEFHGVIATVDSQDYKANGKDAKFEAAPKLQNGQLYVELSAIVDALGGEVLDAASGKIASVKVMSGIFGAPRWVDSHSVVVNKDDADTTEIYKLSLVDNKNEIVSTNDSATTAVVSPNGKYGAFTDEEGKLFFIDYAIGKVSKWSDDSSVKTDLIWSADSSTLFFAQGDKQEKLASISFNGGSVKSLLADKVENKSDIRVSNDGSKLLYSVSITGVASTDKDSTEESLKIDYSGAGVQLYSLDLTKKDAKPVQLTKGKDNKIFANLLADGRVVYISADPEGKAVNDVLKVITADGKSVTDLVADANVVWDTVTAKGNLFVATQSQAGTKVYAVKADGTKTEVASSAAQLTDFAVSEDETQIAAIADGKVVILNGSKTTELTK